MRTDGRTDMAKLTVPVRNFANAPNKCICQRYTCCHKSDTEHFPVQISLLRYDGVLLHHQYCENLKSIFFFWVDSEDTSMATGCTILNGHK